MSAARAVAACLGLLAAASCQSTLPVIDAPPPPPPRPASADSGPPAGAPPGATLGTMPQMQAPRLGVSIFAFSPTGAAAEAAFSPERSAFVATRLEASRVAAHVLAQNVSLSGEPEQATAILAADPKAIDVLLAGTVLPGASAQVRLFARDAENGLLIARSEFEGAADAALDRALEDALAQVSRYWFDLARGRLAETRIDVQGIRTEAEVGLVAEALAAVAGVRRVRHEESRIAGGTASAGYKLTHEGARDAVLGAAAKIVWSAGGAQAHLEPADGATFRAVYGG